MSPFVLSLLVIGLTANTFAAGTENRNVVLCKNKSLKTQIDKENTTYVIKHRFDLREIHKNLLLNQMVLLNNSLFYTHLTAISLEANQTIYVPSGCVVLNKDKNTLLANGGTYVPTAETKVFIASSAKRRVSYKTDEVIKIPDNCSLLFKGGKIEYGVLVGNKTRLEGDVKAFSTIAGTFANEYLDVTWFGAKGDDHFDNVSIISNVINVCRLSAIDCFIPEGIFAITSDKIRVFGPSSSEISEKQRLNPGYYWDFHNIKMFGVNGKSVIKSYFNGDVINMSWMKNFRIEDLCITTGFGDREQSGSNGTNLISMIDVENITVKGCKCYNSYWKVRPAGSGTAMDGGSGISLQGHVFNNIIIEDCEAYNCNKGFDLIALASFENNPSSSVCISNVIATKCHDGIVLACNDGYGRESGQKENAGGKIYCKGRTVNCLRGVTLARTSGANIEVVNTSTETNELLLLSGYGKSWYRDYDISSAPDKDNFGYSTCAVIEGITNCQVKIVSTVNSVNYGYTIAGGSTQQGHLKNSENNEINLDINEDAVIVKRVFNDKITDERKVLFKSAGRTGVPQEYKGCVFVINGGDVTPNTEMLNHRLKYSKDVVFILDGKEYSNKATPKGGRP